MMGRKSCPSFSFFQSEAGRFCGSLATPLCANFFGTFFLLPKMRK
jgi:hypothetical protein